MRQQFGMNQKMQQRMIMTPMLQQAMKILQLSTLELKEWVEKEKRDFMEASITRAQTLAESLEWQLLLATRDEKEKALGKVVIGNLDENGYLTDKVEEIAESQKVSVQEVEKILGLIQGFEPTGV